MLKMCPVIPLYVSRCESGTISDDTEITPLARAGIAVCQRPTDVCFFLFSELCPALFHSSGAVLGGFDSDEAGWGIRSVETGQLNLEG
jgi:hypothetical protein